MKPCLLLGLCVSISAAQEVLTLEQAVQLALAQNRSVAQTYLERDKVDDSAAALKTRRLPQVKLYVIGGQLLTRAQIAGIEVARKPSAFVLGQVAQPLSQQYRIKLQLQQLLLEKSARSEDAYEARRKLAAEVRRTYYGVLELQSSLQSANVSVEALEAAERVAIDQAEVKTILVADLFDVKARLEKSRSDAFRLKSQLVTQKEMLNLLLARPLETEFRVAALPDAAIGDYDIASLRRRALELRPEVRRAEIKLKQADLDKRIKRSEYIPDVSLSVTYLTVTNTNGVLPTNVAGAGVTLEWEGFDWGRKKHEISERDKTMLQSQLELEQVRDRVRMEVGRSVRQIEEARMALAALGAARQSAEATLRVMRTRMEQKAALPKDVLSAQAAVESTDDQHRRALLDLLSAEAELKKALGEVL